MKTSRLFPSAFILSLGGIVALAAAQAQETGSTAAVPDFSGVWARANVPDSVDARIDAKKFPRGRYGSMFFPVPADSAGKPVAFLEGNNAEEVVGDYNSPILQPWVKAVVKQNAASELQDHYVPTAHGTCWPSGVPEVLNLREPVELLQHKDRITIIYQRDHQVREIFLDRTHPAHPKLSWYGDSVGHYEGDTLVVDTVGQAAKRMSVVDPFGTPHTDRIHVTERYRLIQDQRGKGLEVVFTVEDPGAFTMPWKGMVIYRPSRAPFEEVVCAENDRSFGEGSAFGDIPKQDKDF
jgi:hypothetical protein